MRFPQKFAEVRAAYEQLKDMATRVRFRLFEVGKNESLDAIIEELTCRSPRRRMSLTVLLQFLQNL